MRSQLTSDVVVLPGRSGDLHRRIEKLEQDNLK